MPASASRAATHTPSTPAPITAQLPGPRITWRRPPSPPGQPRARGRPVHALAVIAVDRGRGEGREADGDVLRAAPRGAVAHPFPRPGCARPDPPRRSAG